MTDIETLREDRKSQAKDYGRFSAMVNHENSMIAQAYRKKAMLAHCRMKKIDKKIAKVINQKRDQDEIQYPFLAYRKPKVCNYGY